MDFLPKDYEKATVGGKYLKLQEGKNKFRIVSEPVTGYEMWVKNAQGEKRPVRAKLISDLRNDIPSMAVEEFEKQNAEGLYYPKTFVAMAVWNYEAKRVQILNLTQKGIMEALNGYAKNEDWGDPKMYDITITRSGKGLETKYEVMPSPNKGELPKDIQAEIKKTSIDLSKLFTAQDPFGTEVTKTEKDIEKDEEEVLNKIDPDNLPF